MIDYKRDEQQTIPDSQVKIIGLGGAGANMLDRVALDGMEGAELLAVNTDIRTLTSSVATEKIQLGVNLTKGLGCGGDPDMGAQAVREADGELRESLQGRRIVFICVGLGGGTGSGSISHITRIAREQGAFVVVFATMPFAFEGQRRLDQAKTALNEVAALSNALVTFENGRMGELVLAKQGIHDAFSAGDRMISDSIRAVIRLVVRPGIINVGLDDLMTALRTTRSRCLFGSGLGKGENRSQKALKHALSSPLLDRGSLLEDAETVLVHICGGEDLTLYETELLMRSLMKHIPEGAHVLFGAAIDPAMKDSLSVTVISSLPEEKLQSSSLAPVEFQEEEVETESFSKTPILSAVSTEEIVEEEVEAVAEEVEEIVEEAVVEDTAGEESEQQEDPEESLIEEDVFKDLSEEKEIIEALKTEPDLVTEEEVEATQEEALIDEEEAPVVEVEDQRKDASAPTKKAKSKSKPPQTELDLDGGPRGKFQDASPNLFDGEDLDIPPYLRKKKNS